MSKYRLNILNKSILLFVSLIISFSVFGVGGGGCSPGTMPNNGPSGNVPVCDDIQPFCSDENYDFPNVSSNVYAGGTGVNYGCLYNQPNPVWYYMEIETPGIIEITITQSTSPGGPTGGLFGNGLDVDFAMWGPFNSYAEGCSQISNGLAPLQCSYDPADTEHIGIGSCGGADGGASEPPAAQAGEVYIVVITNYDGDPGYIQFSQTNYGAAGAGSTNCAIVIPCQITEVTATPGACDPNTNTFSVSGQITFKQDEAPTTGQLIAEDCNGNQVVVASAPFTSPVSYTIPSITADGSNCSVTAYFSDEPACSSTSSTYNNPDPCIPESCLISNLGANVGACDLATNSFTLSGNITFSNPPTTGQLVVEDCDGNSQTFNAPFTSPIAYSISGINADGANCSLTAHFTDDTDCTITVQYQNQDACEPDCIIGNVTVNTTPCIDGANSTTLSGSVSFSNAPTNGQLVVENCNGDSQTFNAPFTSPINYSILNVNQDGQDCSVTAYFTSEPDCSKSVDYTNPVSGPTINDLTATHPSCYGECDGALNVAVSNGQTPYNYQWMNTNTNTPIGSSLQNIAGLCDGNYSIIVTDANGCITTSNATITEPAAETFDLAGTDPTCGNQDGSITISGLTANTSYQITYQLNGVNSTTTASSNAVGLLTLSNLSGGAYNNFVITGPNGCIMENFDVIFLSEPLPPAVVAPEDIMLCEGESVVLIAGNPNNATITWDNNVINGVSFIPTHSGTQTYTVSAQIDNCITTDQVNITVSPFPEPDFTADITTGCSPLKVNFTNLTVPSGAICTWSFSDGAEAAGCTSTTHTFNEPGFYGVTLTVESFEGCINSITKPNYIQVKTNPTASFSANPEVATVSHPVVEFTNSSINADTYKWDFGDESIGSSTTHPTHKYPENVIDDYIVTLIAYNSDGECTDTVRAVIKVIDELIYYIPNAFTPDGDDYNETFKPIFSSGFDPYQYSLWIYNRWGEIMFESHDTEVGWDGTYGGKVVKEGSYVWKIEFKETMTDKHYTKVGHFVLIR